MATRNLDLALRIKADLSGATEEVRELASATQASGAAAATAAKSEQTVADAISRRSRATKEATRQVNQYGLTAGQQAQAMRQLPAQITDIVTGLASGQSPFMVAIQQGGQLRDAFGGIVPAARALVGAINPATVGLAAIGGAAVAAVVGMYRAEEATNDLARAIELTGNRAGVTRDQIAQYAESAAALSGQSLGTTQEIATQLVATGEFGSQVVGRLTALIADFSKKTGQELEKVSPVLQKAFSDPAKGAVELNRVMNFLSFEQLKYIETLQKQGRTEEAQIVLADALAGKLQGMQTHLNGLSGWWDKLATSAKNAWHEMFAPATNAGKLATLQEELRNAQSYVAQADPNTPMAQSMTRRVTVIQAEIAALRKKTEAEKTAAAESEKQAARNKAHIEAMTAIVKLEDAVKTKTQQRADAVRILDAQLKAGAINQAEYQRGLAAINKKYEDKTANAAAAKLANTYAQQQLQLTKEIEGAKRKLSAAQSGITVEEGRARDNLDAWLELNREALRLQPAQVANLRSMADEADRLVKATADAAYVQSLRKRAGAVGQTEAQGLQAEIESKNLAPDAKAQAQAAAADYVQKKDAETLKRLQRQYLAASGQTVAAQAAQAEEQYGKLMSRLAERSDEAGVALVKKLINVQAGRAELDALQTEVDKAFARQTSAENAVQTQVVAGSLSQIEAQQKLLDIHRATATEVEQLLPRMQQLAETSSDPRAVANVSALRLQVAQLRSEAGALETAFKNAFTSGMSSALNDLATGTKNLGETVQGFIHDLANAMANFAEQQLAQSAFNGLKSMLASAGQAAAASNTAQAAGGAVQTATGAAEATATATAITGAFTAGSGQASLALVSAFTSGGGTIASSIQGAATIAGQTMATAIAGAGSASSGGSAIASAATTAAVAAATGGYISGPGTATSDSIPALLSNGEFVARAAVVSEPGARDFLHAFNRYGMRALGVVSRFADGGLVGTPPIRAAAQPAYALEDAAGRGGAGNVTLNQRLLPVLDDDLIADALKGPKGEQIITLHITRNPGKFRQLLGG